MLDKYKKEKEEAQATADRPAAHTRHTVFDQSTAIESIGV